MEPWAVILIVLTGLVLFGAAVAYFMDGPGALGF